MTSQPDKNEMERDAFLDNLLEADAIQRLLGEVDDREELMREKVLQENIDQSLQRGFRFGALDERKLEQFVHQCKTAGTRRFLQPGSRSLTILAISASVLIVASISIWIFSGNPAKGVPAFHAQALSEVYAESIERGFKPYYECHDPDRFAEVFENRLGHRLALAELPSGSRMLGISYLGGLSRNTTAMLCEVGDQPVIVFVDLIENDNPEIARISNRLNLNVFRLAQHGLVFYEITPVKTPRFIGAFRFLDE